MRVGLFHNRYMQRGGEDAVVEAESALLAKAGHEVASLIVDNRVEIGTSLRGALRTARRARHNPRTVRAVHSFLDRHPIDVAHVHNFFPVLSPALHTTLKVRGIPVVQSLHNYRLLCANGLLLRRGSPCEECVSAGPWHAVRHGCYRGSRLKTAVWADLTAYHRARGTWTQSVDLFLTPSAFAREKLLRAGLPPERVRVVPNPVPDLGVSSATGRGGVYVGRLSHEKGVDLLLDAWHELGDAPLRIVGEGPEEQRLRARARGLPDVRFLGALPREGVARALAAAAFLVQPSRCYEVFPTSVVEAMAAGRAVVVPEDTAVADMVDPGRTGLWFRRGDAMALARACRTLQGDASLVRSLGAEARVQYEDELSPERCIAALGSALASVIPPGRG